MPLIRPYMSEIVIFLGRFLSKTEKSPVHVLNLALRGPPARMITSNTYTRVILRKTTFYYVLTLLFIFFPRRKLKVSSFLSERKEGKETLLLTLKCNIVGVIFSPKEKKSPNM